MGLSFSMGLGAGVLLATVALLVVGWLFDKDAECPSCRHYRHAADDVRAEAEEFIAYAKDKAAAAETEHRALIDAARPLLEYIAFNEPEEWTKVTED